MSHTSSECASERNTVYCFCRTRSGSLRENWRRSGRRRSSHTLPECWSVDFDQQRSLPCGRYRTAGRLDTFHVAGRFGQSSSGSPSDNVRSSSSFRAKSSSIAFTRTGRSSRGDRDLSSLGRQCKLLEDGHHGHGDVLVAKQAQSKRKHEKAENGEIGEVDSVTQPDSCIGHRGAVAVRHESQFAEVKRTFLTEIIQMPLNIA